MAAVVTRPHGQSTWARQRAHHKNEGRARCDYTCCSLDGCEEPQQRGDDASTAGGAGSGHRLWTNDDTRGRPRSKVLRVTCLWTDRDRTDRRLNQARISGIRFALVVVLVYGVCTVYWGGWLGALAPFSVGSDVKVIDDCSWSRVD